MNEPRRLSRATVVVKWLSGFLLATVLGQVGVLMWLRAEPGIYRNGRPFPPPAGYTIDGRRVHRSPTACYLIRVTSDSCPYCRQDEKEYQLLRTQAKSAECTVVEVAPMAGDIVAAFEDRIQLEFIDAEFAGALVPYLTPQTLIVEGGILRWHSIGVLRGPDVSSAAGLFRGTQARAGSSRSVLGRY